MTWSILARDEETGLMGLAIASKFFAVGAMCPGARGKVGILSTQALINPTYAARGLSLLESGSRPADVVAALTGPDGGRDQRQLHLMSVDGETAAHTGAACVDWCGHRTGHNISVAGNMLAGPEVVDKTYETFQRYSHFPLVERLLAAMEAGEAAGGDKRGRQSAALLVQDEEDYTRFSIRADDHADPLGELRRLYEVAKQRFIPFSYCLPTQEWPDGVTERSVIETIIERDAGQPLKPLSAVVF